MLAAVLTLATVAPTQTLVARSNHVLDAGELSRIETRRVVAHPDGGAVAASARYVRPDGSSGAGWSVTRIAADGRVAWRTDTLSPESLGGTDALAILDDGTIVVGLSAAPVAHGVRVQAYEPSGVLRWERDFVSTSLVDFGQFGALGAVDGSDVLLQFEHRRTLTPRMGEGFAMRLDGATGAEVWSRQGTIAALGPVNGPARSEVRDGALYFVERGLDRIAWAIKLDGAGSEIYATPGVLPDPGSDVLGESLLSVGPGGQVVAGLTGQISFLDAAGTFLGADANNFYRKVRWTPDGRVIALRAGAVDLFDAAGNLVWSRPGLSSAIEVAPTATGGVRVIRSTPAPAVRVNGIDSGGQIRAAVELPFEGDPVTTVAFSDPDSDGRQWCAVSSRSSAGVGRTRIVDVSFDSADVVSACAATVPNSSGSTGRLTALGDGSASADDVVLYADRLPPGQTTLFLNSRTPGSTPLGGGAALCLGGSINRYVGTGELNASNDLGIAWLRLSLPTTPDGAITSPVLAGETWYHQAWHRDVVGGAQTSNLTDAVAVTYR
ncbi:MAG: hypothetical protein AAFZ87_04115 [Planctomycetota bacterium]